MVHTASNVLRLGVDVGSTTVKAVITDPGTNQVLFTRYQRHNAHQAATVRQLLEEAAGRFPGIRFRVGVCGSGGRPIAAALGAHYIQEVVANAAAIRALYPNVRTAVELGGQDAKVIIFPLRRGFRPAPNLRHAYERKLRRWHRRLHRRDRRIAERAGGRI